MIQAVLFDFDGLLADSEPLQKAAWRAYLRRHGHELEDDLIDRMFGLRLLESAALVRQDLDLAPSIEEIMADRDAIFLDSVPGALRAMPGAARAVATARALDLKTALATSGHRRYIELALRELDLGAAFDAVVTGDSVPRGKPSPDIFLRAARLLDVPAAACVVVEDAPHGIAAAKAAGMIAVAIPNAFTARLNLRQADRICASLDEFSDWLTHQVRRDEHEW